MVVAGEVSGDIHAGNMLAELHRTNPEIRAFGVGGERLAAAGLARTSSNPPDHERSGGGGEAPPTCGCGTRGFS